jgi:hypothetical protein
MGPPSIRVAAQQPQGRLDICVDDFRINSQGRRHHPADTFD